LVSMPPRAARPLNFERHHRVHPLSLPVVYDIWIAFLCLFSLDAYLLVIPHGTNALRLGLGLAVGLFVPGYLSTLALFPEQETLDGIERTGLSLVLSVVWIPLLALLLSLGHIRLNANHIAWAISVVSLGVGIGGIWRRSLLAVKTPPPVYPNGNARFYLGGLVLALGILTWAVVTPNLKAKSVAFSVLGAQNQLQGYPYQIRFGQKYFLHLQVYNPGLSAHRFRVEMVANGVPTRTLLASVAPGHTWTHPISLPANAPARDENARFLLWSGASHRPLRSLWIRYRIVS